MDTQSAISILNSPQYKGIIFDFDGTLFKLEIDWDDLKNTLRTTMFQEFNEQIAFQPLINTMYSLRKTQHPAYERMMNIIHKYEERGLKEGSVNNIFLNYIRTTPNKTFAIYTMNTLQTIKTFAKMHHLENIEIQIISQDTSTAPKPHDKDLLHITQKWGYNNTEVLFVGDSEYDLKSGKMANIQTEIIAM